MTDLLGGALKLVEQGESMQEPAFYDAAMTGDGEPAMLPLDTSPWKPVYEEAARWIPSSADVIDLGCGTGRFLARMLRTTHYGSLTGLDFSTRALAEARTYLTSCVGDEFTNDPMDAVRGYQRVTLLNTDLREWQPGEVADGTVFTCLEVLEHLAADLDLVRRIPAGHEFVFSVPSYLSASHVRAFPTLAAVFERYGGLLQIRRWSLVDFGGDNVIHVCDSIRRAGAW